MGSALSYEGNPMPSCLFRQVYNSPFAAYFAESQAPIVVLAHDQFAIVKPSEPGNHYQVVEAVPGYGERCLLWQIRPRLKMHRLSGRFARLIKRLRA
jgi:hypothetical protein